MTGTAPQPDLLQHWHAIGGHLGVKPDAARHFAKTAGLPVFKIGKTVAARRSSLDKWIADREADARRAALQAKAAREREAAARALSRIDASD